MKVEVETKVEVTLKLTQEEANWLRWTMQNPVNEVGDPKGNQYREALFKGLSEVLKNGSR